MKNKHEIFEDDWDGLHDVIVDTLNVEPSKEQAEVVFDKLPLHVQEVAFEWGLSDTDFLDSAYEAIEVLNITC